MELIESTEDGWADLRATKWLTEKVHGQGEPIVGIMFIIVALS